MRKVRLNVSIILMMLAIIPVVIFQSYWLSKTFGEEKQDLAVRTNVIFKESVNQCQFEKLKMDTNVKIKYSPSARINAMQTIDIIRKKVLDSTLREKGPDAAFVYTATAEGPDVLRDSMREIGGPGHPMRVFNVKTSKGMFIQIMKQVDSLRDSISVKDLSEKYADLLKRERIAVPFTITSKPAVLREEHIVPDLTNDNKVTVGFSHPTTFMVDVHDTTSYVLKKMWMQIMVSLLLVGLTVFAFIILLRNLIQQQKLTQIKNDFISNITHELKTPIATVSVAIEALKNFNALHDPQRTKEYLDISGNELQRLSLLVDKVLKLSMFEKQQIELKLEKFDLKQLMQEVTDTMKLQFEKYKAQVTIRQQGNNFMIEGDRLHITSVIYNLLDNALKYGRVNPAIQVDLKEDAEGIEMSVTDNGVGISPEYQKKIFDKFFRVPAGDTHNVKGYGLGLSYVADVVRRHKGTILLESQPGIGSRFILKFPRIT